MTKCVMLLENVKCRSNKMGLYGSSKLEEESDFYWAIDKRWPCDNI